MDNKDNNHDFVDKEAHQISELVDSKKENNETPPAPRKQTVRTYRDFAIKALKGKPTSLAKMIINEKNKAQVQHKYSIKNKNNIFLIILSSMLILLGIAAVAAVIIFTIIKNGDSLEKNTVVEPKSLVYFDFKKEELLDGLDRGDIFRIAKEIKDTSDIPKGDIKIFYFTKKDNEGYKILASAEDVFEVLDVRAPYQFFRNLSDDWTVGILSTEGNSPFLILKMKDFDSSYASMLSWENNLLFDIGGFLSVNKKYFAQPFVDLVLYNKDTRVILDDEGYVVFGYSFIDLRTLVFFTDNKSFSNLIETLYNKKEKK
ncbi:MAG: hypothetical protein KAI16_00520 [Candidatus Pacebacteria bacterium]|nr:hypothetical protein [Candidatus Paceibacterota bacterium]